MHWLNLRVESLRSPEFVAAPPAGQAAWLKAVAYCVSQENGGMIRDARNWDERRWMSCIGATLAEIQSAPTILPFDGQDLRCWGYPLDAESEVRAKRKAGRETARKRWGADSSATSSASSSAHAKRKGKGKGKGKGNEKGNTDAGADAPDARAQRLIPPTPAEVSEYSLSIGHPMDGEAWCDSYAAKGWTIGRGKMRDWRAAVRKWKHNKWVPGDGERRRAPVHATAAMSEKANAF